MSSAIRDDRPCPVCGNDGANDETPIFNAVRHYSGIEEFPGFTVNDVGWRCGFCGWEYGFEFSEDSNGDVTMKPCRVVLEIPREMLAVLRKLWLLSKPEEQPADTGELLNHIVNCMCEGASDPKSWARVWLHLSCVFVVGEDPEKVDDVEVLINTSLRQTPPSQPNEGGQNDG